MIAESTKTCSISQSHE